MHAKHGPNLKRQTGIKQFTVTREKLIAIARGQRWRPDVVAGIAELSFVLFCNISLDFVLGNIKILGKQNSLFPLGLVIN